MPAHPELALRCLVLLAMGLGTATPVPLSPRGHRDRPHNARNSIGHDVLASPQAAGDGLLLVNATRLPLDSASRLLGSGGAGVFSVDDSVSARSRMMGGGDRLRLVVVCSHFEASPVPADDLVAAAMDGVNHLLFTDHPITALRGWKVVRVPLHAARGTVPARRVTAQDYKFGGASVPADLMANYDWVLHVDSTAEALAVLGQLRRPDLVELITYQPWVSLFMRRHPKRATAEQEVHRLLELGSVPGRAEWTMRDELRKWDERLRADGGAGYRVANSLTLPATSVFLRKLGDARLTAQLQKLCTIMHANNLSLDQVAFGYTFGDYERTRLAFTAKFELQKPTPANRSPLETDTVQAPAPAPAPGARGGAHAAPQMLLQNRTSGYVVTGPTPRGRATAAVGEHAANLLSVPTAAGHSSRGRGGRGGSHSIAVTRYHPDSEELAYTRHRPAPPAERALRPHRKRMSSDDRPHYTSQPSDNFSEDLKELLAETETAPR